MNEGPFFGSGLKGAFCLAAVVNGGRRVADWDAVERVANAGPGDLKGAAALRFRTGGGAAESAESRATKSAQYDLNRDGTDSACVHVVATPGEPITIVPLHNSIQGQTAYRITVYADAPLAVRPIPAAALSAAAAADTAVGGASAVPASVHDDGEADDDAWSDVGDHDGHHDDAGGGVTHGGAGAAAAPSGSAGVSVAFSALSMGGGSGSSSGSSSSGPTAEELRVFSLLPPSTIRDLAYFSRPPFTALCAASSASDGAAGSGSASSGSSGGGWSKAVLTSAMPPGATADDMIRMPLTEQVFVTVAAPDGGATGAAGGEPLLFAFMELLDASGAALSRPLSTGRLLLCATETHIPAGSSTPERIPEWEVSPKAGAAAAAPAAGKKPTAGAAAGAGAGASKPIWVADFVTPPEKGAPIALPVGCVKLNPVFSGPGDVRTFAICAANCPVPGVVRSRLTIVTNLRLVPPVDGGRAIAVSPPETHTSDAYFLGQVPGAWHSTVHNGAFPAGSMGHGGILMTKQEQFSIRPSASGAVCVLLAAGVAAGDAWPAGACGAQGSVVLAVTPNDTGKQCRSWEASPANAKALAAAGETAWFKHDITEDGNIASVSFSARAGVTYTIMAIPNDWSGKPQFRLSIFSQPPLEAIDGSVLQVLSPGK